MAQKRKKVFELWFRLVFKPLIKKRILTAALRPGNRIFPSPKGAQVGERVNLRVLLKPGDDSENRPAILDSLQKPAQIISLIVKPLGQLAKEDFIGMSPDCQSVEAAKYHLGLIYGKIFTEEDLITLIRWKY
ncbi:MAG: hypothetical protein PHW33_00815 [Candidatus Portnoybacteria bacterium]|nr:hypothetical protein [Candidatus Portnoybacteria bacterium]